MQFKKGIRVIVNLGNTKSPSYYAGVISKAKPSTNSVVIAFDDGDEAEVVAKVGKLGIVGQAIDKTRKSEIPAAQLAKWIKPAEGKSASKAELPPLKKLAAALKIWPFGVVAEGKPGVAANTFNLVGNEDGDPMGSAYNIFTSVMVKRKAVSDVKPYGSLGGDPVYSFKAGGVDGYVCFDEDGVGMVSANPLGKKGVKPSAALKDALDVIKQTPTSKVKPPAVNPLYLMDVPKGPLLSDANLPTQIGDGGVYKASPYGRIVDTGRSTKNMDKVVIIGRISRDNKDTFVGMAYQKGEGGDVFFFPIKPGTEDRFVSNKQMPYADFIRFRRAASDTLNGIDASNKQAKQRANESLQMINPKVGEWAQIKFSTGPAWKQILGVDTAKGSIFIQGSGSKRRSISMIHVLQTSPSNPSGAGASSIPTEVKEVAQAIGSVLRNAGVRASLKYSSNFGKSEIVVALGNNFMYDSDEPDNSRLLDKLQSMSTSKVDVYGAADKTGSKVQDITYLAS